MQNLASEQCKDLKRMRITSKAITKRKYIYENISGNIAQSLVHFGISWVFKILVCFLLNTKSSEVRKETVGTSGMK